MDSLLLSDAVVTVADWMKANDIALPSDLAANIEHVKTQAFFQRALWSYVREFHKDGDVSVFLDKFILLVEDQARRAWNEGMRNVGLDPRNITVDQRSRLQEIVNQELNRVLEFAGDIEQARIDGKPVEPFKARVDLWANRYPNIVNEAQAYCKPYNLFVWRYGDTKQHCSTCYALNGIVATGDNWRMSGVMPQNPPNQRLECGGWRCRCRLEPTTEPPTQTGIPAV